MKKALALTLSAVMTLSLLAGCGGQNPPSPSGSAGANDSQPPVEEIVRTDMNSRIWSEVTTMDPTLCTYAIDLGILYNIYDCFFEPVDGDYNNLKPCLVESYTVNESATYYEFKVRENVKWQNGDILDVDDCVFSVERMRSSSVTAARISAITEVAKVDDTTFSVTCAYPMPRLPALFSTASMSVVNKDLIEQYGDNAPETIVGTGAYKLESWDTDKIVLTSFDEGWRGAPEIKTLTYLMIVDGNAARAAFDNGDVDVFYPDNMDVVNEYTDETKYRATPYTTGTTDSLVFNVSRTDSWVSNATFRQAVAYCIDREVLCEIATDGMYRVVDSIFAPGNGAYDADWVYPYSYNPDKAKELLAECGYDGAPVQFGYCSAYPIPTAWATTIENYMRQVGINVTMEGTDLAGATDLFARRDYDMACMEYCASYPDPLSSIYAMFRSDGYYNSWCYSSDELDEKVMSLYGIADMDEQAKAMQELDHWAQTEAFYIPCYQVGGYTIYPATLQSSMVPEPMFGWAHVNYSYWITQSELAELLAGQD